MVYSTRRFVLSLSLCYFVLVFFSPFSIAITSLGEERIKRCLSYVFSICTCLVLSVSSSSSCPEWAAAYDCGTTWTFLLSFILFMLTRRGIDNYNICHVRNRTF